MNEHDFYLDIEHFTCFEKKQASQLGLILGCGVDSIVIEPCNSLGYGIDSVLLINRSETKARYLKVLYSDKTFTSEESELYTRIANLVSKDASVYEISRLSPISKDQSSDHIFVELANICQQWSPDGWKGPLLSGVNFQLKELLTQLDSLELDRFGESSDFTFEVIKSLKKSFQIISDMDGEFRCTLDLHPGQFMYDNDELLCIDPAIFSDKYGNVI